MEHLQIQEVEVEIGKARGSKMKVRTKGIGGFGRGVGRRPHWNLSHVTLTPYLYFFVFCLFAVFLINFY